MVGTDQHLESRRQAGHPYIPRNTFLVFTSATPTVRDKRRKHTTSIRRSRDHGTGRGTATICWCGRNGSSGISRCLIAHPLLPSPFLLRNAPFSPDGKFVGYASSETGSREVYVSPFPSFNSRWQVSKGRWRGGTQVAARWEGIVLPCSGWTVDGG